MITFNGIRSFASVSVVGKPLGQETDEAFVWVTPCRYQNLPLRFLYFLYFSIPFSTKLYTLGIFYIVPIRHHHQRGY